MYYYSQIEYFYSHNIIPGVQFVIDDDEPSQAQENPNQEQPAQTGGQTTGLYGYFERALDRVVPPRVKNILSFATQPGNVQPANPPPPRVQEPADANEIEPNSPQLVDDDVNEEDSEYGSVQSDDEDSDSDQSTEESEEVTELAGKKSPENVDMIRSKFKGTKLDYFYRRDKAAWI